MSNNRGALLKHSQKTQIRRVVLPKNIRTPAPNVCVKACNGSHVENLTIEEKKNAAQIMTGEYTYSNNKFAAPQYNTVVRSQHEVIAMDQMNINFNIPLTPRTQASIAPMITQRMNFPPNAVVYRDLTSLNVNDSVRELAALKNVRKKKIAKNSVDMPDLSDYLEDVDELILVVPEPSPELTCTFRPFDFLAAYKRYKV